MIFESLSQEINVLHAEIYSALGDPSRLLILCALNEKPKNVSDLATELGLNQPTVSRHLGILKQGGLVVARQEGLSVLYKIQNEDMAQFLQKLTELLRRKLQVDQDLLKSVEGL